MNAIVTGEYPREILDIACKAYNDQAMQLADAQYVCMNAAIRAIAPVLAAQGEDKWKQAYEAEAAKFRAETLRTSELHALLNRFVEEIHPEHRPGPWSRGCVQCKLIGEAMELLQKPVNAAQGEGKSFPIPSEAIFDRWFYGSKYMQVVTSIESRQPALDGWNAAINTIMSAAQPVAQTMIPLPKAPT